MKKSLSIILCAVMIALTFCSCKFVKSKENRESATSANSTTTTTAETEEEKSTEKSDKKSEGDGESITVYVTDKNGEVVTEKNGTPKTEVLDLEKLQEQLEKEISNQATPKKSDKTDGKKDKTDDQIGIIPPDSSEEDLLPDGDKSKDTTLKKTVIEPIIKSGTYTIKGNIKAGGQGIGATIALRNGGKDYSATVSMGAIAVRVFSNNGKYYMALPTMGKYAEVSSDDVGDIGDLSESFNDNGSKYVQTTKVKSGAQTYTCEEYKTSTGTMKYYFNSKNEWKRMEIVDGEDILVWEITSFSKNADKTLFEVSKLWYKDNSLMGAL